MNSSVVSVFLVQIDEYIFVLFWIVLILRLRDACQLEDCYLLFCSYWSSVGFLLILLALCVFSWAPAVVRETAGLAAEGRGAFRDTRDRSQRPVPHARVHALWLLTIALRTPLCTPSCKKCINRNQHTEYTGESRLFHDLHVSVGLTL